MRVCLVYDCLYPYTVGGGERWFRALATGLAEDGHEVTYLTRRQWPPGEAPAIPGVTVEAVSPGGELYSGDGQRRIWPPIRFGLGVFAHMLRNRRRYDVIYTAAFPYFSLPAIRAAFPRGRVWVDWFECWSADYWRGYLGGIAGRVGHAIQRMCVLLTPRAFVISALSGRHLRREGFRGELVQLAGLYDGPAEPLAPAVGERAPLVVFAGRQIPEKRADALPAAVAAARREVPGLRARILGDGPERPRVLAAIEAAGASEFVEAPGFVSTAEVQEALASASCHVLPSQREGYGMVVIEAAAAGTPSVVVAGADNAAADLIEPGVNGYVAASEQELAALIVRVQRDGAALRERTIGWYREHARQLSVSASVRVVAEHALAPPARAR